MEVKKNLGFFVKKTSSLMNCYICTDI